MSWDPVWESVFSSREWGKYPSENLVRFIARTFYRSNRPHIKILEIGCGTGANLWFCARENFSVYGIDASTSAINICKDRLNQEIPSWSGQLVVGGITELDFPSDFFDCVLDIECGCCLTLSSVHTAYSEVLRVLKPGSPFFVRTFAEGSFGDKTGKQLDATTFLCSDGPAKGLGPCRYTPYLDIPTLLKGFEVRDIELSSYTVSNLSNTIKEWSITAIKPLYN